MKKMSWKVELFGGNKWDIFFTYYLKINECGKFDAMKLCPLLFFLFIILPTDVQHKQNENRKSFVEKRKTQKFLCKTKQIKSFHRCR